MLLGTLASAMDQTYPNTEIVVYDDGSTDDTAEVLAPHLKTIIYQKNENVGISRARTNAAQLASGEFIAFLDDDDLMPPDRLSRQYARLLDYPDAVFSVGEIALIDQTNQIYSSPELGNRQLTLYEDGYEAVMWPHVPATVHTTLFRRKDGESIGWFDASFDGAGEDKDFYARLGRLGPVIYEPHIVSLYRQGHESLTNNTAKVARAQLRLFATALGSGLKSPAFQERMYHRLTLTLESLAKLPACEEITVLHDQYKPLLTPRYRRRLALTRYKQALKRLLGRE